MRVVLRTDNTYDIGITKRNQQGEYKTSWKIFLSGNSRAPHMDDRSTMQKQTK